MEDGLRRLHKVRSAENLVASFTAGSPQTSPMGPVRTLLVILFCVLKSEEQVLKA